jgi:hypothetical protein
MLLTISSLQLIYRGYDELGGRDAVLAATVEPTQSR